MERTPQRPADKTPKARWHRAVAKVCAQQAVVHALAPEPAWRELRSYAMLLVSGVLFAPISQTILLTSVYSACTSSTSGIATPSWIKPPNSGRVPNWVWPTLWWRGLTTVLKRLLQPDGRQQLLHSTSLFALHDAVTRGRMQWVEQATDAGAVRPKRPIYEALLVELAAGAVGSYLSLEYMRSTLGGGGGPSRRFFALGLAASTARGIVVATGGQWPHMHAACSWTEFMLEVVAEREGANLLGFACPLVKYVAVVLWGICNFLPWGMLIIPSNNLIIHYFGKDPIVKQKEALESVAEDLEKSLHGRDELVSARNRAKEFMGQIELTSLWRRASVSRIGRMASGSFEGAASVVRTASSRLRTQESAQRHLETLLNRLAVEKASELQELLAADGFGSLEEALTPITVRRNDMVRSGLTQIADRTAHQLLLGITGREVPGLKDSSVVRLLGLRVQFLGEDGIDMGGVRRDFMDCFAAALTKAEAQPLALVEPVTILGLGADSTWRPAPSDQAHQGFLWAFGRLLALALVYRCPCPIQLSSLVFKCILGMSLRPGDVRQLDPDFWRHRVRPLLEPGGADERQARLREWGMDPLVFTSADGAHDLKPDGANIEVSEENRMEYAQLLCEDFLIGSVRTEMGCLVMGFHEIVPQEYLQPLDAEQLRMLVCGVAEIHVDEWEEHAVVEGDKGPVVASWFFAWLRKRPQETRSKMLAFVTGSSVLPSGWEGLKDQEGNHLPFRIAVQGEPHSLPSAHTCANLLVLPPVESQSQLESRLDMVVEFAGREMMLL